MIRNEGLPGSCRWTQSRGGQRGVTLERPKHEKDKSLQGALQPLPQRSAVCCARCQDQRWGATVRSHPLLGPDSFKQGILFNLPVNYVVPIVAHLLPGLPYKVPQTAWLQTTEMYRLVVWRPEVRHQGACKLVPSEAAREGLSQVPPPPAFCGLLASLPSLGLKKHHPISVFTFTWSSPRVSLYPNLPFTRTPHTPTPSS